MAISNRSSISTNKKKFQYLSPWNPTNPNTIVPSKQVVTCFLQQDDKILVLQRARKDEQHGLWGIPGGKLDHDELPVPGLLRELKEETGLKINPSKLKLLGTALSHTSSDGQYGLYLFHIALPDAVLITINQLEHYEYRWVTLDEFESMNLLTAQGEAYRYVKEPLVKILQQSQSKGVENARRTN